MCTQVTTNYDKGEFHVGKLIVETTQYATTWIFWLVQVRQNSFNQAV